MTLLPVPARVLALLLSCSVAVAAAPAFAQPGGGATAAPSGPRDCSRWPASVFDEATASCVCPALMWWNLRGDACLPREHAAAEFCSTVWPSSSPYLMSGGGYRCVCAPPLMWNEQATACRPLTTSVEMDCAAEWPGTLPVLSPSGTEYECRCPGGRRWDEPSRSCVAGAPVVAVGRSYGDDPVPGASPGPGYIPSPQPVYPQDSPGGFPASPPPTADGGARTAPSPPAQPIPGAGSAPSAECASLLSEIRMRAQSGQAAEADSLGMKAAIAGCDPAAIADAARTRGGR
jgi:hypothetical protein